MRIGIAACQGSPLCSVPSESMFLKLPVDQTTAPSSFGSRKMHWSLWLQLEGYVTSILFSYGHTESVVSIADSS